MIILIIKTRYSTWILFCLLMLVITACQSKQNIDVDTLCPIDEVSGDNQEDCAPIQTEDESEDRGDLLGEAAYPIEENFTPVIEAAYPITETDLAQLLKSWRLISYAENSVESEPSFMFLTFNADGSYAIATETESENGTWTTILSAMDSILILDPDTDEVRYYQIIDLQENLLNLRTQIGGIQIDEGFLPNE